MANDPEQFKVTWHDHGRWPRVTPNPDYPDGRDVDLSNGAGYRCKVLLPYPAKRIGRFLVRCHLCSFLAVITTAGRPDDPRSVTCPCKARQTR